MYRINDVSLRNTCSSPSDNEEVLPPVTKNKIYVHVYFWKNIDFF